MTKPELYEHIKEAASHLAKELQKARDREKKLDDALKEVFPIELYTHLRPDVEDGYNGNFDQIVEHFVNHGINEMNLKKEISQNNRLALRMTESCLKTINFPVFSKQLPEENERKLSFLTTKGDLSNLRGNPNHTFAIQHTSVHYKSGSVCTWIPKNGCSNLRYSFSKENGAIADIEEIEWIHRNNDCFNASIKEALQANYSFVILRNPFKRLLSFFLDKLCHPQNDQTDISRSNAQKVFRFNEELSYLDFINNIWERPDLIYKDEHTNPQCDYLLYRNYDDYFALEEIGEANQKIFQKTGIKLDDIRDKNSIFTSKGLEQVTDISSVTKAREIKNLLDQNKVPIVENMYTNDMIKKVATLYLQDIFLYWNKIPNGMAELDYWVRKAAMSADN